MTRETTLGYKYGVLRVQPQAYESVPVKQYSHRNGESEQPTVNGWFWFDGTHPTLGIIMKRPILVESDGDDPACVFWYGATDDANEACADGWLHGQWWGPVVPPWGSDNGSR